MVLGAAITAVLAFLAFHVVQTTGTAPIMAGETAEQWTAQELRRLKRHGWRLVNHFNLADSGDIDHLLVGPFGAIAVETRWSAEPWMFDHADGRLTEKVSQVRKGARRLENWHPFRSQRIQVRPVVMLWGRGVADWPEGAHGFLVDDVQVVAGPRVKLWRRSLPQEAILTDVQLQEVWIEIDRQIERRDDHDRAAWPVPPSPLTLYMRGVLWLATFAAGFLVAGRVLEPLSWARLAGRAVLMLIGGLALRHRATKLAAIGWLAGVAATLLTAGVALILAWTGAV